MKKLTILGVLLLVLLPAAGAQKPKVKLDPEQRYLLLATKKTSYDAEGAERSCRKGLCHPDGFADEFI